MWSPVSRLQTWALPAENNGAIENESVDAYLELEGERKEVSVSFHS